MARRGLRHRLVDRADDPAIYSYAVQALARGPADMDSLRVIISLRPPDSQRDLWAQAIRSAAATLPIESLPEVDDLLADASWGEASIRRDVLLRASVPATPPLATNLQIELLRRLASVLIDLGEGVQAYEVLKAANGATVHDSLKDVRFQAAALSGHYDEAVQMQGDPAAWIALAQTLADRNPQGAAALRDEINRRFGNELTQQQRGDLDGKTTASADAPVHKARP
jgi:hypothetical protein